MSTPRGRIEAELLGRRLSFITAPGLFCADRIDDGTRLLLEHLPARAPASVLDLGCGYGALGLPIAAAHPDAELLLVDRDLLAVEAARANAELNGLARVRAQGSLGYRDVGDARFDWVLCNVPARIGEQAIEYILGAGTARLTADGELRVVVIRDLGPVVERVAGAHRWPIRRDGEGERHFVYALGPIAFETRDHESFYARDIVTIEQAGLERPHDINEDQAHLATGIPLWLECLPKSLAGRALAWRGGYGAAAITLARRGARVVAADRDLLATTYVRRNAARAGVDVETREGVRLEECARGEKFHLVAAELAPMTGDDLAREDLLASVKALRPGGMALWFGLEKQLRERIDSLVKQKRIGNAKIASRGPFAVMRVLPGKK